MPLTIPSFKLFPPVEQEYLEHEYFNLSINGGHAIIKEINSWPIEYKQNISLIIAVAQFIVRGCGRKHDLTIPAYKVFVKYINDRKETKKLVCTVRVELLFWHRNTDDFQELHNECDKTTLAVLELLKGGNDGTITE